MLQQNSLLKRIRPLFGGGLDLPTTTNRQGDEIHIQRHFTVAFEMLEVENCGGPFCGLTAGFPEGSGCPLPETGNRVQMDVLHWMQQIQPISVIGVPVLP